jgi:predicted Zn-dependent protease
VGHFEEGLAGLDAAPPAEDARSLTLRIRAAALTGLERREEAVATLEAADPTDAACAVARAELLAGLGKPEEAANALRAALQAVPGNIPLRLAATVLHGLAA